MKEREETPAEKVVSWWKGDEGVEALEAALADESLSSGQSVAEAFLAPQPTVSTTPRHTLWLSALDFIWKALLVLGIGLIGWGLWRLPGALPAPATPQPPGALVPLQQLTQVQIDLADLTKRMATVEADRPRLAAMVTVQTQVAEIQRALSATPTPTKVTVMATFSPTPTLALPTTPPGMTPTITPTAISTFSPTLTWTPFPSMTLPGPEGKYLGTVTPRTGPGIGSDNRGIYEQSTFKSQPNIPVYILGQWTRDKDWLFVTTSKLTHFFWVSDNVSYQGEAPAIALPWWKPIPAPTPWQEDRIDDLSVYTISVADFTSAPLPAPARWKFEIVQEGEYTIEAWMPSESGALLTYRIEMPEATSEDNKEMDQSALPRKPGFYEIGTYRLKAGTLQVSMVKAQAGSHSGAGATAAVGPLRLVRKP